MFSSSLINTGISVIFIIFTFSIVASMALEYYNKISQKRGKFLLSCLSQNLRDEFINQVDFSLLIYSHPLVSGLKEDKDNIPSYISSDVFATVLIDVVINYGITYTFKFDNQEKPNVPTQPSTDWEKKDLLADYQAALSIIKPSSLKTLFQTFAASAKSYNDLKKNIMVWYDHYMDRVSGWYKKSIAKTMFLISLTVTILFNVDTVHVVRSLQQNTTLSNYISSAAQDYVQANKNTKFDSVTMTQVKDLKKISDNLGLPVGYNLTDSTKSLSLLPSWTILKTTLKDQARDDGGALVLILGWLISAVAISKGGPFWFDLLSKVVNVRMAGGKPATVNSKKDSDG